MFLEKEQADNLSTCPLYNRQLIFIVTCLYLNCLILEWFLDQFRSLGVVSLIFPAAHIEEVLVVALSFSFFCLMLLTEVTTATFLTMKRIVGHEFAHQDEVTQVDSLVKLNVEPLFLAWDEEV